MPQLETQHLKLRNVDGSVSRRTRPGDVLEVACDEFKFHIAGKSQVGRLLKLYASIKSAVVFVAGGTRTRRRKYRHCENRNQQKVEIVTALHNGISKFLCAGMKPGPAGLAIARIKKCDG